MKAATWIIAAGSILGTVLAGPVELRAEALEDAKQASGIRFGETIGMPAHAEASDAVEGRGPRTGKPALHAASNIGKSKSTGGTPPPEGPGKANWLTRLKATKLGKFALKHLDQKTAVGVMKTGFLGGALVGAILGAVAGGPVGLLVGAGLLGCMGGLAAAMAASEHNLP